MPAHCPGTALSDGMHCRVQRPNWRGRVGRNWPVLPSKPDFQDKTSALMVLERHEGSFVCLWVKGRSQLYCHNRLQAGEPQNSVELALGGGQRSTGEGRQVDRANLLVTVAAGMFWQIQSDSKGQCYCYVYGRSSFG